MVEIDCRKAGFLVDAVLDGEADLSAREDLDLHLAKCPSCQGKMARHRQVSLLIGAAGERYGAPVDLKARILAALPGADGSRPVRRWLAWWAPAAWGGSALALAASLALFLVSPTPDSIVGNVVDAHLRSLAGNHLTDVPSTDRHTVKPWFNGRTDLSPPVPDLSDVGFPLVGGRLDYVAGRPAAALIYSRHRHILNLFTWPEPGGDRATHRSERQGYTIITWRRSGLAFALVSDLNPAEMEDFVTTFMSRTDEIMTGGS